MTDTSVHTDNADALTANEHLSLELEQNDYSRYLLYSRSEILFVLRAIIQKGALLTVHFDNGNHFFLTALLAISDDGKWVYFDPGSDEAINKRALAASKLIFTTMLDKVKVQFSLASLMPATEGKRQVFAGKTPETVLRLQRREYYRLSTPISNPLHCMLNVPKGGGDADKVDAVVVDISGGGVGLQVPIGLAALFEAGKEIPDAKINLPDEGLIVTTLCVRNSYTVTGKSGQANLRVGCEFVNLPGTRLTMIQRYITRIERERKARADGLE
jgi:c-di-GMP-binding flagellar brake protein YcgR